MLDPSDTASIVRDAVAVLSRCRRDLVSDGEFVPIPRPTDEERRAALAFFEAVAAHMDAGRKGRWKVHPLREITLAEIKRVFGLAALRRNHHDISPMERLLDVAGLQSIPALPAGARSGNCSDGLDRGQIERAILRLRRGGGHE